MLNIDSIENGIVVSHITAGRGMRVYELWNWTSWTPVSIIRTPAPASMAARILLRSKA